MFHSGARSGAPYGYGSREVTPMTEADWWECSDWNEVGPGERLDLLNQRKASRRKFRLYACACCRRVWHLLDIVGKSAVEVAERFADGLATEEERLAAET